MATIFEIAPQPKQKIFLACNTDFAIYGGAAGGGKSFATLLDDLYDLDNRHYWSVCLRRERPQIKAAGSLWPTAKALYIPTGAVPNESELYLSFPNGARIQFAGLQHEDDKYGFKGAQIPRLRFDEIDEFTETQVWYLTTRNRSPYDIRPYTRGTCNANSLSWVASFIQWWWDEQTGYAIPNRSGIVRWYVRDPDGQFKWSTDPHDLPWYRYEVDGEQRAIAPRSFTFIPAKLTDNAALLKADPTYLANLLNQDPVTKAQLLDGNWLIRPAAGLYFKRGWLHIVKERPAHVLGRVRRWDWASTADVDDMGKPLNPDWTAGALVSHTADGRWWIEDIVYLQGTPREVQQTFINTVIMDGHSVTQIVEQEPGASGKFAAVDFVKMAAGYTVKIEKPDKAKDERIKPLSSQCEVGNLWLVHGAWNERFIIEAESFPKKNAHDDGLDASSGAFKFLSGPRLTGQRTAVSGPRDTVAAYTPR